MPAVTRLGDICTGHGCFPPRESIEGSPNVFCNSIPVHRQFDEWAEHCCSGCHDGELADGSETVFVNSKECGRITDPVSCGSYVATGSPNVFAGG